MSEVPLYPLYMNTVYTVYVAGHDARGPRVLGGERSPVPPGRGPRRHTVFRVQGLQGVSAHAHGRQLPFANFI